MRRGWDRERLEGEEVDDEKRVRRMRKVEEQEEDEKIERGMEGAWRCGWQRRFWSRWKGDEEKKKKKEEEGRTGFHFPLV
jgi:hypothetical protein